MTALGILSQGLVGKTIKLWRYTNNAGVNKYRINKQMYSPIDNVLYLKITKVINCTSFEGECIILVKGNYAYSTDDLENNVHNGEMEIDFEIHNKLTIV